MTHRDLKVAFLVAAVVAGIIVAINILPESRAVDQPAVTAIPFLRQAQLAIPAVEAKIVATAEPTPGQPVVVTLTLTSSAKFAGKTVPVNVAIVSSTMDMMSRVDRGSAPTTLATTARTLTIGDDGKATVSVPMPLTWAAPVAPKAAAPTSQPAGKAVAMEARKVTTYQIMLSSPLSAPTAASTIAPIQARR
jgi:hypothetical protein